MSWYLTVKKSFRNFWVCFSLFAFPLLLPAQELQDSSSRKEEKDSIGHSPKRAAILSAICPSAGQFYNHNYWKPPIIYAGFGALGYAFAFNQGEYKRFGDYYKLATDDDPDTNPDFPGTPEQLRQKRNYYKKYRDLSIIGMVGLYALQILDANVEAHLKYFDISDDLSLHWTPSLLPSPSFSQTWNSTPVLSFQLRF